MGMRNLVRDYLIIFLIKLKILLISVYFYFQNPWGVCLVKIHFQYFERRVSGPSHKWSAGSCKFGPRLTILVNGKIKKNEKKTI